MIQPKHICNKFYSSFKSGVFSGCIFKTVKYQIRLFKKKKLKTKEKVIHRKFNIFELENIILLLLVGHYFLRYFSLHLTHEKRQKLYLLRETNFMSSVKTFEIVV